MLDTIDWAQPLCRAVDQLEKKFGVSLCLDSDLVKEIGSHLKRTVEEIPMDSKPNVAKIAGHAAFWIRKLKPIHHDDSQQEVVEHKLLNVNELAAILVGAGICQMNFREDFRLPNRIFFDWASSLRINSHSPASCAIAFELLASSTDCAVPAT